MVVITDSFLREHQIAPNQQVSHAVSAKEKVMLSASDLWNQAEELRLKIDSATQRRENVLEKLAFLVTQPDPDELLNVTDLAKRADVSRKTIYTYLAKGLGEHQTTGGFIKWSDFVAWRENNV